MVRHGRAARRGLAQAEARGGAVHRAPHRPQRLCLALRLRRPVENRHPRLPERELHVRPLLGGTRQLHRAQPDHLQARLQEGERRDPAEVDYPQAAGGGARDDCPSGATGQGRHHGRRLQEHVAFLENLQGNLWHGTECRLLAMYRGTKMEDNEHGRNENRLRAPK